MWFQQLTHSVRLLTHDGCCTVMLTCAKAMLWKWIGVMVPSGDGTAMPLLTENSPDGDTTHIDDYILEDYMFTDHCDK